MKQNQTNQGLSNDTKTLIVVLTLIFVYPVGLILMYLWMKWNGFVKFIVSLPVYIVMLSILAVFLLGVKHGLTPSQNILDKSQCKKACQIAVDKTQCEKQCIENLNKPATPYLTQ